MDKQFRQHRDLNKHEMINVLENIIRYIKAHPSITDRSCGADILRPIYDDCEMELKLVDGAMATVGESVLRGYAVELRFTINCE